MFIIIIINLKVILIDSSYLILFKNIKYIFNTLIIS